MQELAVENICLKRARTKGYNVIKPQMAKRKKKGNSEDMGKKNE